MFLFQNKYDNFDEKFDFFDHLWPTKHIWDVFPIKTGSCHKHSSKLTMQYQIGFLVNFFNFSIAQILIFFLFLHVLITDILN